MSLTKGNFSVFRAFQAFLCLLFLKNYQPKIISMHKRHIWGGILYSPSAFLQHYSCAEVMQAKESDVLWYIVRWKD